MSELLANLALGFSVAAHPYNIGFCLLGALVGTLVGVLPGIGTVATVAMLLPITFGLPPVGALIMLAGDKVAPVLHSQSQRLVLFLQAASRRCWSPPLARR